MKNRQINKDTGIPDAPHKYLDQNSIQKHPRQTSRLSEPVIIQSWKLTYNRPLRPRLPQDILLTCPITNI